MDEAILLNEHKYDDLTGDGMLLKKVLKEGDRESGIQSRQIVTIEYTIYLPGLIKIEEKSTIKFIVGEKEVVDALDIAVSHMKLNEQAAIMANPSLTYGSIGMPPSIPPDTVLLYVVELLKVEKALNLHQLAVEERLKYGTSKAERGKELLQQKRYDAAAFVFKIASDILKPAKKNEAIKELLIKCLNNKALAFYKAYRELGKIRNAIEFLEMANVWDQDSQCIKKELAQLREIEFRAKNQQATSSQITAMPKENFYASLKEAFDKKRDEEEVKAAAAKEAEEKSFIGWVKKWKYPLGAALGVAAVAGLAYSFYKSK